MNATRFFPVQLRAGGCVVAAVLASHAPLAAAVDGPGAPVNLRCEGRIDPLGIDAPRPRLSWQLADPRPGACQSAWQVLVASRPEALATDSGDLWDSGKVESDQSIFVEYAGKALSSRARCHWKIRAWDRAGAPSPWSAPATWEMGLLRSADWQGRWVSPATIEIVNRPIPLGRWIGPPPAMKSSTVHYRVIVDCPLNPAPHHATAAVCASGECELFVNGKSAGRCADATRAAWVTLFGPTGLRPGANVLGVKVTAAPGAAPRFALGLRQVSFGGAVHQMIPAGWLCNAVAPPNWAQRAFPALIWKPAAPVPGPAGATAAVRQEYDGPRRSQLLRREFVLPARPVCARLYVTGLGCYEATVNGRRVGDDIFAPGWTLYDKRIQYQTHDVTALVESGPNAIGAILGNGWWSSGLGWGGGHARHATPGENLRLLAQLEVECADGSRHVVATDGRWTSHLSPIVEDTLYHGETHDARLEMPGWDKAGFKEDAAWGKALDVGPADNRLCAQADPPIRVTEELEPVSIAEPVPGVHVFDFGQNHSGRPRLTVRAPAGTTVTIRHAELLGPDGRIFNVNYRSARVTDTYICRGTGVEVWEPKFTYRGYRYAQVTGLPVRPGLRTLVSRVLHTAAPEAGTFECSVPLIGRILGNVGWGLRSNLHSVPTDCPQRDERLGWLGDAQMFAPASLWMMDLASFYAKWTRDILDSQSPDGGVNGVSPTIVLGPETIGRSAWADAVAIVPWRVYEYCGDRRLLATAYEGARRWIEFMRARLTNDLYEKPTWGDWVPVVKTPELAVSAAYGVFSTRLVARMAAVLGRGAEAKEYDALATRMAAAYEAKYRDPATGGYRSDTQCANLLPIVFGVTPENDASRVLERIVGDAVRRGFHHTTGFIGTALILPALAERGHADLAWRMLSSEEYPSLGYMLKQGATTVWERWNTDKEGPAMNSHNHFALGSMVQWCYEGLAGVRPDADRPGFKHFVVEPQLVGNVRWVRLEYPSPYGLIRCEWSRERADLKLSLTVPPNTTATVSLPTHGRKRARLLERGVPVAGARIEAGRWRLELEAGRHEFTAQGIGAPPVPDYRRYAE